MSSVHSLVFRNQNPELWVEVDGGVDLTNTATLRDAGANVLVAGTALFKAPDMAAAIVHLRG